MTLKLPEPIPVRLSQDVIDWLEPIAKKRRISIALVIRSMLVEIMRDDKVLEAAMHDQAAE